MSDLIISVSGVRGIVGEGLTADVATAFAAALATYTKGGHVVLSRDGRPSGEFLKHAVLVGLLGGGCIVHDIGVAPTPTCGIAVRKTQSLGGIQITASHNPAAWNGLKLFGPEGSVLAPAEGEKIRQIYEKREFTRVTWDKLGPWRPSRHALDWHCQGVLPFVDADKIKQRKFTIFVDGNGGSGGPLARQLLRALEVVPSMLAGDADGKFLHEPEPIAANLTGVCHKVPQNHCDLGFVLDPDADRLAIIDEQGRYIGEEATLALAVSYRLRKDPGPVVINMSTSRMVEDMAKKLGVPCHRSAVGEANVVAMMKEVSAAIGGEGNGGVIDPRVGWVRDPFIGMGLILSLLAETGKTLSAQVAELPKYAIIKDKYDLAPDGLPKLYKALIQHWPKAKVNRVDGMRLEWLDRWVHVRPSNTEPIVRVIAEAPVPAQAQGLCKEVGEMLGQV